MKRWMALLLYLACYTAYATDLPTYAVRPLGAGMDTLVQMNNRGDLIGFTRTGDSTRYFQLSDGVRTWLPERFQAIAINDDGVIAGTQVISDQSTSRAQPAYLRNGQLTVLDTPGAGGYAMGINSRGDLAGFYLTDAFQKRAFSYVNGQIQYLPGFNPDDVSEASAINDAGIIVGSAGRDFGPYGATVAWTPDGIRVLTGNAGTATAINQRGTIVGFEMGTTTPFNTTAFIAYPDQTVQSWGASGEDGLRAMDINDADLAVGIYLPINSPESRGLLFIDDTMVRLDDLIDPASGWRIMGASAINDAGLILASGCRADGCGSVMLTPVPEPGMTALVGTGLLVLMGASLRRRRNNRCIRVRSAGAFPASPR